MKHVVLALCLILCGLSVIAVVKTPSRTVEDGRQLIVWATDDNPRRREQVDLFNQLNPGFKLRVDANNNAQDKVLIQSLAGVGPDAFDSVLSRFHVSSDAGLFYDITDELESRGVRLEDFWPMARATMTVNGRIVGMPCNVSSDGLWFHRDIFVAEGIPLPPGELWDWDDFVEIAKRLTKRDENGRIIRYGVMGISWPDAVATSGGRVFTPDGRRCVVDSPEAIEGVRRWIDLMNKHNVMPTPEEEQSLASQGGWGQGIIRFFQDRRTVMARGGRWWLSTLRDLKGPDGKFPLDLGVVETPVVRKRKFRGGSRVAFVNALAPNRERAIEFMVYLASDEYGDQLNRDADAMPGRIATSDREAYYFDPTGEGRDGGASPAWKRLLRFAFADEMSPYVPSAIMWEHMNRQTDLARIGVKSVEQAMKDAATAINREIRLSVERNPALRARYESGDTTPFLGNVTDEQFPDIDPATLRRVR